MAFRVLDLLRRYTSHRATVKITRKRITPPTTPPAMAAVCLFKDKLTNDVVTDGPLAEDGEMVEAGVEEDGGIADCDGVTTQDTSSPFVTLKVLDGMTPAVAYTFMRYHPWGMFTLDQSNLPAEALTVASVVFTTDVLCRETSGYPLRSSPLWSTPMFVTTKG